MEDLELSLTEAEFFALLKIAHERDITFNQLINDILREVIAQDKPIVQRPEPVFPPPERELSSGAGF